MNNGKILDDATRRQLLAEFLRSRRAAIAPVTWGLKSTGTRRTPGLRREELATLANVGVAWYTALEQAKDVHPSEGILSSLARVLQMSEDEKKHLFFLAGQFYAPAPGDDSTETIPGLATIISALSPLPAYVLDRLWNYVAWNDDADRLFDLRRNQDSSGRNLLRELFLNDKKKVLYSEWDAVAAHVVSEFRAECEPFFSDPAIISLVESLQRQSVPFAQLWSQHPILGTRDRAKVLIHPERGTTQYEYTTLRLAVRPTWRLVVYTPVASP